MNTGKVGYFLQISMKIRNWKYRTLADLANG